MLFSPPHSFITNHRRPFSSVFSNVNRPSPTPSIRLLIGFLRVVTIYDKPHLQGHPVPEYCLEALVYEVGAKHGYHHYAHCGLVGCDSVKVCGVLRYLIYPHLPVTRIVVAANMGVP